MDNIDASLCVRVGGDTWVALVFVTFVGASGDTGSVAR